jgi:hypothetical protein
VHGPGAQRGVSGHRNQHRRIFDSRAHPHAAA